uniref:Uncharacterized protein n=1 Tax=viral metagenome TaxID=1070528 RepID=A0A6C0KSV6_9ZZZZ
MEYGCLIEKEKIENGRVMDENFYRYVGWSISQGELDKRFFSEQTVRDISLKLKELLKCLRKDGRAIVVADRVIAHMMSEVFYKNRPQLGNGYFMYTIPAAEPRNDYETMKEMVIEMIFHNIKTEYEIDENNKKLTIWTSVLGDFNKHGLRQYTDLKINEKNINKVRFNMNY